MLKASLNITDPNRYLPTLLLMGPCLGFAVYFLGSPGSLGEALVVHTVITLCIGYGLIFVIFNKGLISTHLHSLWLERLLLGLAFVLVGVLGTEIEQVVRNLLFEQGPYRFFSLNGGHAFNAILSPVLGFAFVQVLVGKEEREEEESGPAPIPLEKIPLKKGEHVVFMALSEITHISAYDMYAYLYDVAGEKHLCDYSLGFLEQRLPGQFVRVHRKYIVNQTFVSRITPHHKGRYELLLADQVGSRLVSSSSYTQTIKSMIKISD